MEALRWGAMVAAIIAGLVTLLASVVDLFTTGVGALVALVMAGVIFVCAAITPRLPGWMAIVYAIVWLVLVVGGALVSAALAFLPLLAAIVLGGVASFGLRKLNSRDEEIIEPANRTRL